MSTSDEKQQDDPVSPVSVKSEYSSGQESHDEDEEQNQEPAAIDDYLQTVLTEGSGDSNMFDDEEPTSSKYNDEFTRLSRELHSEDSRRTRNKAIFQCHHCKFICIYKWIIKNHIESVHSHELLIEVNSDHETENDSEERVVVSTTEQRPRGRQRKSSKPVKITIKKKRKRKLLNGMPRIFKCHLCANSIGSQKMLNKHYTEDHDAEVFMCPECEYGTPIRNRLVRHVSHVHIEKNQDSYKCMFCDFKSDRKDMYKKHLTFDHTTEKPFKCPQCDYSTNNNHVLKVHISSVHEGDKPYSCPHCEFQTTLKSRLLRHVAKQHEGEKPFRCEHCSYMFTRKQTLDMHVVAKHRGQKPYGCPHCDYRTGYKGTLRSHMSTVHSDYRPFSCPHCHYSAKQKGNLTKHLAKMHPHLLDSEGGLDSSNTSTEQPSLSHLSNPVNSIVNNPVFIEKKPFACQLCQYSAKQKISLNKHIAKSHPQLLPNFSNVSQYIAERTSLTITDCNQVNKTSNSDNLVTNTTSHPENNEIESYQPVDNMNVPSPSLNRSISQAIPTTSINHSPLSNQINTQNIPNSSVYSRPSMSNLHPHVNERMTLEHQVNNRYLDTNARVSNNSNRIAMNTQQLVMERLPSMDETMSSLNDQDPVHMSANRISTPIHLTHHDRLSASHSPLMDRISSPNNHLNINPRTPIPDHRVPSHINPLTQQISGNPPSNRLPSMNHRLPIQNFIYSSKNQLIEQLPSNYHVINDRMNVLMNDQSHYNYQSSDRSHAVNYNNSMMNDRIPTPNQMTIDYSMGKS